MLMEKVNVNVVEILQYISEGISDLEVCMTREKLSKITFIMALVAAILAITSLVLKMYGM